MKKTKPTVNGHARKAPAKSNHKPPTREEALIKWLEQAPQVKPDEWIEVSYKLNASLDEHLWLAKVAIQCGVSVHEALSMIIHESDCILNCSNGFLSLPGTPLEKPEKPEHQKILERFCFVRLSLELTKQVEDTIAEKGLLCDRDFFVDYAVNTLLNGRNDIDVMEEVRELWRKETKEKAVAA